jgi:ribosomal protein L34
VAERKGKAKKGKPKEIAGYRILRARRLRPIYITSLEQLAKILDRYALAVRKSERLYYLYMQKALKALENLIVYMEFYSASSWNYIIFKKLNGLASYLYGTYMTVKLGNISPTLADMLYKFLDNTRRIFCKRTATPTLPEKMCTKAEIDTFIRWQMDMSLAMLSPADLERARRIGFPRAFQSALGRAILFANRAAKTADFILNELGRQFVSLDMLSLEKLSPEDQERARRMIEDTKGLMLREMMLMDLTHGVAKKINEILLDAALELGMVSDALIEAMFKPPRSSS